MQDSFHEAVKLVIETPMSLSIRARLSDTSDVGIWSEAPSAVSFLNWRQELSEVSFQETFLTP
jgi:hypothetical protein